MTNEKITCCSCGLNFFADTITFHNKKAYCHICDLQYITDELAQEKSVRLPGYFINEKHYYNFLELMQLYEKYSDPFQYKMAAYINGIPAIFSLYPKQHSIFIDLPFLWQFDWYVYELIKNNTRHYHIQMKDPLVKNTVVKQLISDYQILLETGQELFNGEFSIDKGIVLLQLSSSASRQMATEMFHL